MKNRKKKEHERFIETFIRLVMMMVVYFMILIGGGYLYWCTPYRTAGIIISVISILSWGITNLLTIGES